MHYAENSEFRFSRLRRHLKVDDYLRRSSITGPGIFMVVFSHEKEGDSVKNNLVIVKKILRFVRGLTAENTNSQISQNRARLRTFKKALKPSESLPDLK